MMKIGEIRRIVEAALLVAGEPLSVEQLERLFVEGDLDGEEPRALLREVLGEIEIDCEERGYELVRVASGYRFQVRQALSEWISRLWEQKPPRYSRALLETLALIAYRQPATRGDIEEVRFYFLLGPPWLNTAGTRRVLIFSAFGTLRVTLPVPLHSPRSHFRPELGRNGISFLTSAQWSQRHDVVSHGRSGWPGNIENARKFTLEIS